MGTVVNTEIAVIGGGPAGLAAAALLGALDIPVAMVAPPAPADTRTTALMQSSLTVLEKLGIWPALAPKTGALKKLRLVDASGSLVRAPETLFDASELGLTAFGHNIENTHLLAALREAAASTPGLIVKESQAVSVAPSANIVRVTLKNGDEIHARLVVGADGRNSICRAAAGIEAKTHDYPQAVMAFNISHTRPHESISTEFHRRGGPLTLVPLPGERSSVVLVGTPDEIARISLLDDATLGKELETAAHGLFGCIAPDKARGSRALSSLTAESFAANRIALVGESAHVLPPIGAQGLNLGIRDAAAIAALTAETFTAGKDPGRETLLAAYNRNRQADARPRHIAVDLLNRSLIADLLPLDIARAIGLWTLSSIPTLRREVMRRGAAVGIAG